MAKTKGAYSFNPDMEHLTKLYAMGCTDAEVAAFFGVAERTILRRKKTKEYQEAMEQGIGKGKLSLRRKQYEVALSGNIPMLIWLGKNRLDQRDKPEDETAKADTSINISFQDV